MRKLLLAFPLFAILGLTVGCGETSEAVIAPDAPLTDEQKAQIKLEDQQIDEMEGDERYNP